MLYEHAEQFYHLAGTCAKGFEETYSNLMRFESSKADNGRIPTVEERMQLSYDIFKIDNTEMARVLTIIETSCPSALTKKVILTAHSQDVIPLKNHNLCFLC